MNKTQSWIWFIGWMICLIVLAFYGEDFLTKSELFISVLINMIGIMLSGYLVDAIT